MENAAGMGHMDAYGIEVSKRAGPDDRERNTPQDQARGISLKSKPNTEQETRCVVTEDVMLENLQT